MIKEKIEPALLEIARAEPHKRLDIIVSGFVSADIEEIKKLVTLNIKRVIPFMNAVVCYGVRGQAEGRYISLLSESPSIKYIKLDKKVQAVEEGEIEPIPWENFSFKELECRHCQKQVMDPEFMVKLVRFRKSTGISMPLSSAYRCPEHNQAVSPRTGLDGPHTTGRSVDVLVYGGKARKLLGLSLVYSEGPPHASREIVFTGIGVKQHGPFKDRIIHLDDLPNAPGRPRPWVWTY